jgi:hypothetical protein
MGEHTDNRCHAIAALAVRDMGGSASSLLDYMSDDDKPHCKSLIKLYSARADRRQEMDILLKRLVASERFSSLAEVHPAWILEHLRDETARVVGIILRSLPSKHVRFLIENLPPHIREALPGMVESFAVASPVLNVIRQRFESHFLPMRISRTESHYEFANLYYLRGEELEDVLRDIGLSELAIAFSGLSGRAMRAVYNRLDLKDAKRLQRRGDELSDVSPELFRQARYNVLEIEENRLGPKRMLMRLGLAALASTVDGANNRLVKLIQQKLPPHDGYFLKRLIDEKKVRRGADVSKERQEIVLQIVVALAREGRIDQMWVRFEPSAIELSASPEHSSDDSLEESSDEETKTVQLLA